MNINFDPNNAEEVSTVLRFLRLQHPILWGQVGDCPMEGLSMRTRNKLQEHCLCTPEQIFSKTRQEAVNLLGEVAITEIESLKIGSWDNDS